MEKKNSNKKAQESQNISDQDRGLNRRRALKKMLVGASPLLIGYPLQLKAWGQPASAFSSNKAPTDSHSFSPEVSLSTSNINEGSSRIASFMPTPAPMNCDFVPNSPTPNPTPKPTSEPTPKPTSGPTPKPTSGPTPK